MSAFVLNFKEFEDRCFCVCSPPFDLSSWQLHMFAGTKKLRNNSFQDFLDCARYDRLEASEQASWSSHSDNAFFYSVVINEHSVDRVFVYEEHSTVGNYEMNLVINYLDVDKLYEKNSRLEDEEYVLSQPDFTGSSLTFEQVSIFRTPYNNSEGEYKSYDTVVTIQRRTWEIQEDKTIIENRTIERTITDRQISSETGESTFVTRAPIISNLAGGKPSSSMRLLRETYDPGISFEGETEETLTIDAMLGSVHQVVKLDESSSEMINTRFGREAPSHTLTSHNKADSTLTSKVERLTPPLVQIVASVQDVDTLKFFPHGEGRFELDQFTLEEIPIEPGRTSNGLPLTFSYGDGDNFERLGWVFNEEADSLNTNTTFIKFYSPILERSEVTEYTCLTTKDRETNYVNDGVSHGGFHYPGRKFDPADVDG